MRVSVLIVTYNHEKVIAQTIESALMQKVNFEYEIVIGEDYSTDNTRQIVIDYQKEHSDQIRLLLPEKNLGAHKNFINTLQACQGQYIAYLEGDDYWTADDKLQKQVDLLDNHPEYTMCFHNVFCFREDNQSPPSILNYQKTVYTIEDLLISNFISSPSVMYRSGVVKEMPVWFSELSLGDWPFFILQAQYGKIGYIDEVMAAYRIHAGGAWSSKSRDVQLQQIIQILNTVKLHIDTKYEALINKSVECYAQQLLNLTLVNEDNIKKIFENLHNRFNFKNINIIAFPDWHQPDDILEHSLYNLISRLLVHPHKEDITLLLDTTNISEEEADLYVSSIVMNWVLENEVETSEDINIVFTSKLNQIEWRILLPLLKGRIILDLEDTNAIFASQIGNIPAFSLDQFSDTNLISPKFKKPYQLNIGCGNIIFDGWINLDIGQNHDQTVDLICDATKTLPFDDNSCSLIYNEHFLEHLRVEEGLRFLKECYRILKSGGVLRIAMPSLTDTVEQYMSDDWRNQDWLNWPEYRFIETRAEMINIAFRWWGHQWLYDREELHRRLKESGYTSIKDCEWGKSDIPELRNRESRAESLLICEVEVSK